MMPMQRLRTRLEADRAELAELLAATPDDLALEGDTVALRLCLERVCPPDPSCSTCRPW